VGLGPFTELDIETVAALALVAAAVDTEEGLAGLDEVTVLDFSSSVAFARAGTRALDIEHGDETVIEALLVEGTAGIAEDIWAKSVTLLESPRAAAILRADSNWGTEPASVAMGVSP